jgi:hypothetical protein
MLLCERKAGSTDCVELVVFAAQPPLAAAAAVDLMHLFALALQMTDKPGAVMAGALDRPTVDLRARADLRSGRRPRSRLR